MTRLWRAKLRLQNRIPATHRASAIPMPRNFIQVIQFVKNQSVDPAFLEVVLTLNIDLVEGRAALELISWVIQENHERRFSSTSSVRGSRFAVRGSREQRPLTVGRKIKREMVLRRVPPRRMLGIGVAEHAPASAEPVLAVFSPVVLPAELVPAVIAKVPPPERRVPACQSPVPMLAGKFRALFHGFRRRRNRFPFCRGAGSGAITGFFLAGTGFGWIAAHGSHGSARQPLQKTS